MRKKDGSIENKKRGKSKLKAWRMLTLVNFGGSVVLGRTWFFFSLALILAFKSSFLQVSVLFSLQFIKKIQ